MLYKIPSGKHYAKPFRLNAWWGRDRFRWKVLFTPSCRYDLGTVDQCDINKLCGVGYLPGHHIDSARYGWRYNAVTDRIELFAYCYINKIRVERFVTFVKIGQPAILLLDITYGSYIFEADGKIITVKHNHSKKLQYRLHPYFGGNIAAPHLINIELKNI